MDLLKWIPFILIIPGFATVYMASFIVNKFDLSKKVSCKYSANMCKIEEEEYRMTKALVTVKVVGFMIALPGIIMFLFLYK